MHRGQGDCLEVAGGYVRILLRDSKSPSGPALVFLRRRLGRRSSRRSRATASRGPTRSVPRNPSASASGCEYDGQRRRTPTTWCDRWWSPL
ncbi:DUF397 domain-containing protein [Streptomyces sp. NPDC014685]|uniref:DUF397 domain-containing protein n=1 Tax=Streptomyces sp. NPDC014685 TaxID=3364881 RepID=UPI00370253D9